MSDYSPGMRVIIRNEEWMIRKTERNSLDNQSIYCVGVSPLVKDREAIFLADLEEIVPVDPAKTELVPDSSQLFKRSRLFIESQWRKQIPTKPGLYIGDRAAMDLMNFQLEPARIALKRPRQRILIADSVGLGKTLEAGILMSELILRGKGKRILVVTVKSMMTQFQKEMWNRFTIPLVRLDSNKIQRIRAQLPANYNPFFFYDKTIISMDTLKRDLEYRTHLENASWDIIVIDEAHNVAKRGGKTAQRAKLADLLKDRSDTLIMLTATPHDGRAESFASLIQMLDSTAIANVKDYRKEDIQDLCIRRFKKDVKDEAQGAFQERSVVIEHCPASPQEEQAFSVFADMQLQMDRSSNMGSVLFKTGLEKALFSSPAACMDSIRNRLRKLEKRQEGDSHDAHQLKALQSALEKIDSASFSRYVKLIEFLRVLEAALKTLENCSCREIDGRDGCYRCLFAYRQSRNIGQISRKTAMQLLQTILSGNKDISHLRFGHTFCEAWYPHPVNPHLAIYTSIDATQKRDRKGQADILVQAVLNDDPEGRGTHFGQELNALWQFANLMQFSSHFSAVTIMGMAAGLYHSIVPPSESLTQVDNPWADTFELLSSDALAVAEALAGKSIPPPSSVGFELWLNGLVVAEAEMAWESRRIAFLLSHQMDSKTVFEEAGWHIFTDESSLNEALFAGG